MAVSSSVSSSLRLVNATFLDVEAGELREGASIIVEDGVIQEISSETAARGGRTVDMGGLTVLPGLIDCHVHVTTSIASFARTAELPNSLVAIRAARIMREMLERGFTTVRDAGGADIGLVQAVEEGDIEGPRLVISGKALSQTCGHADFRPRFDEREPSFFTRRLGSLGRICDGADAVRWACREEIKAGAKFIKIMANGGVASPNDPIDWLQFSREEIAAAVEEATNAKTYVAAHLYTDEAIRRCVELGVRSIEHSNFVTPATAKMMAEAKAFACPTLISHHAMSEQAAGFGLGADLIARSDRVRDAGGQALRILADAGVKMAYGTDLTGPMHSRQSEEFIIRSAELPAIEIIRSATSTAAELLMLEGQIGVIKTGAFADFVGVRGNPLQDVKLLSNPARFIPFVMKGGQIVRNERPY